MLPLIAAIVSVQCAYGPCTLVPVPQERVLATDARLYRVNDGQKLYMVLYPWDILCVEKGGSTECYLAKSIGAFDAIIIGPAKFIVMSCKPNQFRPGVFEPITENNDGPRPAGERLCYFTYGPPPDRVWWDVICTVKQSEPWLKDFKLPNPECGYYPWKDNE